ncbi:hypothetical protein [Methanosarcina lacustris]|uniref:hypothetical protein n=1 Tax=Methanosarcina lacustris TaxID=170861 RepID=UPI00064E2451|nr:hypothetical protein [Methanosarcina lacustris]
MRVYGSSCNQYVPKVQIIKRRVDPARLTGAYYAQVKYDIKRKINDDTELLIIKIIPKCQITKKWVLMSFLDLQRELTSIITIPENSANIEKKEFDEFERMFNCTICYD